MANDRLIVRCTKCGDYDYIGQHHPLASQWVDHPFHLQSFINTHIAKCVDPGNTFGDDPIPIVLDSETTFCAAGGIIGGSGNIFKDKAKLAA